MRICIGPTPWANWKGREASRLGIETNPPNDTALGSSVRSRSEAATRTRTASTYAGNEGRGTRRMSARGDAEPQWCSTATAIMFHRSVTAAKDRARPGCAHVAQRDTDVQARCGPRLRLDQHPTSPALDRPSALATLPPSSASLAQLVEQLTLNQRVQGSSP
jgi:hypothetical protein